MLFQLRNKVGLLYSRKFTNATFLAFPHDISFLTALEIGRKNLSDILLKVIRIIGIEIPVQENITDKVSEDTIANICPKKDDSR